MLPLLAVSVSNPVQYTTYKETQQRINPSAIVDLAFSKKNNAKKFKASQDPSPPKAIDQGRKIKNLTLSTQKKIHRDKTSKLFHPFSATQGSNVSLEKGPKENSVSKNEDRGFKATKEVTEEKKWTDNKIKGLKTLTKKQQHLEYRKRIYACLPKHMQGCSFNEAVRQAKLRSMENDLFIARKPKSKFDQSWNKCSDDFSLTSSTKIAPEECEDFNEIQKAGVEERPNYFCTNCEETDCVIVDDISINSPVSPTDPKTISDEIGNDWQICNKLEPVDDQPIGEYEAFKDSAGNGQDIDDLIAEWNKFNENSDEEYGLSTDEGDIETLNAENNARELKEALKWVDEYYEGINLKPSENFNDLVHKDTRGERRIRNNEKHSRKRI